MNPVIQYLKCEVTMLRRARPRPNVNGYCCIAEFILRHGREFKRAPQQPHQGMMKQCFLNASKIALSKGLIYCEGYAAGIIPVLHAWLINEKDEVIDPTWKDGDYYFGIPIKTEYLRYHLKKFRKSGYSLLQAYHDHYPIIHEKPSVFKYEKTNHAAATPAVGVRRRKISDPAEIGEVHNPIVRRVQNKPVGTRSRNSRGDRPKNSSRIRRRLGVRGHSCPA